MKILIVGAGPSGLTAALELTRQGIMPDIIDKKQEPSSLSRAVGIFPATMKLLEPSGVTERLEAEAIIAKNIRFHKEARQIAELKIAQFDEKFFNLYALAQDRTEAIFSDRFHELGGRVEYGAELTGLTDNEEGVEVQINNETCHYDLVIGADGAGSRVRQLMGIDFVGYDLDGHWSIADIYTDDYTSEDFCVYFKDTRKVVIMIPIEVGRFRVISNSDDALGELPIEIPISRIKRSAKFQISVRQAETYAKGHVYLVGDAAHAHSPVGGRGMNLGIADAADLAGRIIHGGLEDYHKDRHKEGKRIINFTERGRKLVLSNSRFVRSLVFMMIGLVSRSSTLSRRAVKNILTV